HLLVTHMDHVNLRAAAADKPVHLSGTGSYNGAPLALEADLASFDALRDAAIPYDAKVNLTSGDSVLRFDGTMTAPLDVDGVQGRIELVAPNATAIARIFGGSETIDA